MFSRTPTPSKKKKERREFPRTRYLIKDINHVVQWDAMCSQEHFFAFFLKVLIHFLSREQHKFTLISSWICTRALPFISVRKWKKNHFRRNSKYANVRDEASRMYLSIEMFTKDKTCSR